jgi:aspartyl-tRNA(Asn)/glutamyl-tRNA(Gln) amidotransferase subunit A
MTTRLIELGAVELSRAYADGSLSPVEVVQVVLARIDAWEPRSTRRTSSTGGRASPGPRQRGALAPRGGVRAARRGADHRQGQRGAGRHAGAAGLRAFADAAPSTADSPPAARVREAGCVVLGKTTMPDFGMLASGVSSLHGRRATRGT